MILLSSFQLLGPSQKLVSKLSTWKLKTKVENPKVGHDFSVKFSTFGALPKTSFQVENLKEKSCPTFGFSTLVFNFWIENLETNFWMGPKSWKLERKIMSYLRVFNCGFQLSSFESWKLESQFWGWSQKLKTWKKNQILPLGFQLWFSTFKLKTWKPPMEFLTLSIKALSVSIEILTFSITILSISIKILSISNKTFQFQLKPFKFD